MIYLQISPQSKRIDGSHTISFANLILKKQHTHKKVEHLVIDEMHFISMIKIKITHNQYITTGKWDHKSFSLYTLVYFPRVCQAREAHKQ